MIGRRWWAPWLWIGPALAILGVFLVYPVVDTVRRSFLEGGRGGGALTLDNYRFIAENPQSLVADPHTAIVNTALWIVLFTAVTVTLGLLFAVLSGRVRYEAIAKSGVFVPMAISFVAAAVIWRFMLEFNQDIGTVNAVVTGVGIDNPDTNGSTDWLRDTGSLQTWFTNAGPNELQGPIQINNMVLIGVGVWMWTGFAMVVLSAGLKGISGEVLEAARVDGANEWQVFRRIIVPILSPTIMVVATTLVIFALKIFDLVWVITGGRADTEVIATLFFREAFLLGDFGLGAAIAVVLLLWVVPLMVISIRRFQFQEEIR